MEVTDYDNTETSSIVDRSQRLSFDDLGLKLPDRNPTEVVSIRLPYQMLNELRALGSERDIPYQALMKLFLAKGIAAFKKGLI